MYWIVTVVSLFQLVGKPRKSLIICNYNGKPMCKVAKWPKSRTTWLIGGVLQITLFVIRKASS